MNDNDREEIRKMLVDALDAKMSEEVVVKGVQRWLDDKWTGFGKWIGGGVLAWLFVKLVMWTLGISWAAESAAQHIANAPVK